MNFCAEGTTINTDYLIKAAMVKYCNVKKLLEILTRLILMSQTLIGILTLLPHTAQSGWVEVNPYHFQYSSEKYGSYLLMSYVIEKKLI